MDKDQTFFSADFGKRVPGEARRIERWMVPIPGVHNALNALAAISVASEAGIPDDCIRKALASFAGIKRRFQLIGTAYGVSVYDDYGPHPNEIKAVLAAAREGIKGKVFAVFEPHRYSRVRDLFQDFCNCLENADKIFIMPLYSAGEKLIDGISSSSLAMGISSKGQKNVIPVEHVNQLASLLCSVTREGDIIVFLGAGHSTKWAHILPRLMAKRRNL